jgi:hypothetical protein
LFFDLYPSIKHYERKSAKWDNYRTAKFLLDSYSKEGYFQIVVSGQALINLKT